MAVGIKAEPPGMSQGRGQLWRASDSALPGLGITRCPSSCDMSLTVPYQPAAIFKRSGFSHIVVYSAIMGGHDHLKSQPRHPTVDFVCFTDNPRLNHPQWNVVHISNQGLPNRLSAKRMKMCPDRWVRPWTHSIWIDASVQIKTPAFYDVCVAELQRYGIAMFRHPDRDCIYDEAEISMSMAKYEPQAIERQIRRLRSTGFPAHAGLWACGIIGRRSGHASIAALGRAWLTECFRSSPQDQISLPPLLNAVGLDPGTIPGNLWSNDLIEVHPHLSDE